MASYFRVFKRKINSETLEVNHNEINKNSGN
jgi:hypothetical protein